MPRFYILAFAAVFLCASSLMMAQSDKANVLKKIPSAAQMLNNSAQGREYWLAIPPNEFDGVYTNRELEIYVTASKDTKVTLEYPGTGFKVTKTVQAMKITTFSTADKTTNWIWEVREDEKASNMAVHLTADQPISVYVLNAKYVTSDGYLALPTTAWDKEYRHCSFYDFGEIQNWAGGFIVIAKENGTVVNITLDGVNDGGSAGRTRKNRKLGDKISVPLQQGQVYMVRGNGLTLGLFDLTGSRIVANKPIGLISFHQRTMIPAFPSPNNGRDHLCEMLPPVSTWGKQYFSIEMDRARNQGDMFRVVAKEANTKFKCRYTDLETRETFTWEGVLKEAGDFMEKENSWPPSISIRGMAHWTADKPILVMQYSYSSYWDGEPLEDPAMCLVVPVEQYTMSTVFQTPSNAAYVNNFLNLLAIGDSTDPVQTKLQTVTIEGSAGGKFKVADKFPLFLVNRIPGTNIYWARLKLPVDAYHLYAETPFGATMYGFNEFESYYWPSATALNKIDQLDTLKPLLDTVAKCGDYEVTATERRDQAPNAAGDSTQIDSGIIAVELDAERSYNYDLEFISVPDANHIPREDGERREELVFRLKVKDKSKDAFAIYYVLDRAGNTAIDSVSYVAELVVMQPDSVLFGKVRINTSKVMSAKVVNPTTRDIEVQEIRLGTNREFKILTPDATAFPLTIPAKGEIEITFEYTPTKEIKKETDFDIDTVLSKASCGDYPLGLLIGQGVMPHIIVEDWDAKRIQSGTQKCNTDEPTSLLVKNPGTDALTITDIQNIAAPFELDKTTMTPPLPIVIPAGGSVVIKTICYKPQKAGDDKLDVTFVSDADTKDQSNDNISQWKGIAENPGPNINDWDFGIQRIKTRHIGTIELINTGAFSLTTTGFKIIGDQTNLKLIGVAIGVDEPLNPITYTSSGTDEYTFESPLSLHPNKANKVVFTVEFIPQTETLPAATAAPFTMKIEPVYSNSDARPQGTFIGKGMLPHILTEGFDFTCIKQGTASLQIGQVTVRNTGDTSDLNVKSITWQPNSAFEFVNGGLAPFVLKKGESASFDVTFRSDISTASYLNKAGTFGNPNYLDEITVVADTKEGDGQNSGGDFYEDHLDSLTGCDFTEGEPLIAVNDINFGEMLLCDAKEDEFTIRNDGSIDLSVTGFVFTGNTSVFEIYDKTTGAKVDANTSFTVPAGGTRTFRAIFTPKNGTAPYTLDVEAISNAASGKNIATLRGSATTVSVTFSLSNGTKKYLPGDEVDVNIRAKSLNMAGVKLNTFTMVLNYDSEALRYTGQYTATAGLNGWNITITPDKPAIGQITIVGNRASGADFVQEGSNGEFLSLKFGVYLSAKKDLPVTLSVLRSDLGDRAVCVIPQTENSRIDLGELCVREFRTIKYTGESFSLRQNSPNPVGDETDIEYSVAFEVPVKLAVYNIMGEEVKVLVEGTREAGVYRVRLTQGDLPSGTYIYRLSAGPYTESKQMVITK